MKNHITQTHGKEYVFFWKPEERNGFYSQWYPSNIEENNVKYSCNEQYMMAHKALLFKDIDAYKKIMNTSLPRKHKEFGRGVQGFDKEIWDKKAQDVVYNANYLKFTQNKALYNLLIDSGSAIIAEASPKDPIRGIGLDESNATIISPQKWPGSDYLGKAVMKVRDAILDI